MCKLSSCCRDIEGADSTVIEVIYPLVGAGGGVLVIVSRQDTFPVSVHVQVEYGMTSSVNLIPLWTSVGAPYPSACVQ